MKKGILFFLSLLSSQVYSYELIQGDYFVFTDLLVWKLREGSSDNWSQAISPTDTIQTIKIYNTPFGWDPGFRMGLGKNACHRKWDYSFAYTHFQTTGSRVVNALSGGIDSAYLGNFYVDNTDGTGFGPTYQNAGINWKFAFNTFDFNFGHSIQIDSVLSLRPTIGIKAAIINQTISTNWQTPTVPTTFTNATETLKNNFWGIGPSVGLESIWPICSTNNASLHLRGNILGAILAGNWKFSENYLNNTPFSVEVNLEDLQSASSMASGFLGLGWLRHFSHFNFTIKAGYEAQVWFNQIQYYNFNMGRLNHLMSLQGGVLDFYVYF